MVGLSTPENTALELGCLQSSLAVLYFTGCCSAAVTAQKEELQLMAGGEAQSYPILVRWNPAVQFHQSDPGL